MHEGIADLIVEVFARCLLTHQLRKHRAETHTKRQSTQHGCLSTVSSLLDNGDKGIEIVYDEEKNFVLGQLGQPRQNKNIFYRHDKPKEPFTLVSTVSCCQPGAENVEWYIEDQAFLCSYDLAPRPSPPPPSPAVSDTQEYWEERRLADGGERGVGGRGANTYDSKKVLSSINHSILSSLEHPALATRGRTVNSMERHIFQFVSILFSVCDRQLASSLQRLFGSCRRLASKHFKNFFFFFYKLQ